MVHIIISLIVTNYVSMCFIMSSIVITPSNNSLSPSISRLRQTSMFLRLYHLGTSKLKIRCPFLEKRYGGILQLTRITGHILLKVANGFIPSIARLNLKSRSELRIRSTVYSTSENGFSCLGENLCQFLLYPQIENRSFPQDFIQHSSLSELPNCCTYSTVHKKQQGTWHEHQ